jgi:hypothetical protein
MGALQLLTISLVAVTYPAPAPVSKYVDEEIEESMMPGEPLGTGAYVRATYYPVNTSRHLTSHASSAYVELVLSGTPANASTGQRVVVAATPTVSTDDLVTNATLPFTDGPENATANYSTTVHVPDLVDLSNLTLTLANYLDGLLTPKSSTFFLPGLYRCYISDPVKDPYQLFYFTFVIVHSI